MKFQHPLIFMAIVLLVGSILLPPAVGAAEAKKDAQTIMNEMRLKKWAKDLTLTAEQQKKVLALYEDEAKQIAAIDNDASVGVNQRVLKVNALRQETFTKMKPVLTPEQLATFEKLLAKTQKKK